MLIHDININKHPPFIGFGIFGYHISFGFYRNYKMTKCGDVQYYGLKPFFSLSEEL